MKKIFILTGEASGDKLASTVIEKVQKGNNDIKKGENILKKINAFDHTQAIIVRENSILKETSKGTKNLIKKIKKTKIKRGVLIKYPKKKQDMRVDLPTIGLNTLKDCKKASLKGIVLKDKQNIFLEKNKCINFAIKNKMFILVK